MRLRSNVPLHILSMKLCVNNKPMMRLISGAEATGRHRQQLQRRQLL